MFFVSKGGLLDIYQFNLFINNVPHMDSCKQYGTIHVTSPLGVTGTQFPPPRTIYFQKRTDTLLAYRRRKNLRDSLVRIKLKPLLVSQDNSAVVFQSGPRGKQFARRKRMYDTTKVQDSDI